MCLSACIDGPAPYTLVVQFAALQPAGRLKTAGTISLKGPGKTNRVGVTTNFSVTT